MRQGHQNRRGRNRNNGGARKGQNPVSRSYESNGPDMKIRGTPAHIAEKYLALSRDAQSNGDPVLSENYLQHAEHYNRIILAYRDAQSQHSGEQPGGSQSSGNGHHRTPPPPGQEQPYVGDAGGPEGPAAQQDGNRAGNNGPSQPRRHQGGRNADNRSRPDNRGGRGRKPRAEASDDGASPRNESSGVPEHEQPEFLRRSIRRPRRDVDTGNGSDAKAESAAAEDSAQD